ncbi:MAG TPA: hypothetical protein VGR37_14550 [Longimicrobiaceae bacterium]|nr:hypothetical protein [Longimicrobiaceae bacterium]
MTSPELDEAGRDRLRAELQSLDGVRAALLDGPPLAVHLVCERGEPARLEMQAGAVLARHGLDRGTAQLHVSFLAAPQPARRVRFRGATLHRPAAGRAVATVSLEWEGCVYEEQVEGESGDTVELRLAALATLRSIGALVGEALRFRLVGIRTLRAFDTDLVAVLLHADHGRGPLIGASLARESPHESAAIAVLNATNRVMGNYLMTGD